MDSAESTASEDAERVDMWDRDSVVDHLDKTRKTIGSAIRQSKESRDALEKALESHDQVAIKVAQFRHDRHVFVMQELINQRSFLVSQLQHLDAMEATKEANRHARALKWATWALVLFTVVLSVVTMTAAFIARS